MTPAKGRDVEDGRYKSTQRLYRCTNPLCHIGWIDRDANAARNIAQVGYHIIRTHERPVEFTQPRVKSLPGYNELYGKKKGAINDDNKKEDDNAATATLGGRLSQNNRQGSPEALSQ